MVSLALTRVHTNRALILDVFPIPILIRDLWTICVDYGYNVCDAFERYLLETVWEIKAKSRLTDYDIAPVIAKELMETQASSILVRHYINDVNQYIQGRTFASRLWWAFRIGGLQNCHRSRCFDDVEGCTCGDPVYSV